ncbi:MAG: rRNA maturation RNase YbeY [Alphaproteobacteria bacterium]|nr:rRNA maturation RNase YbeY [Alphaproteobacteria bacterium]
MLRVDLNIDIEEIQWQSAIPDILEVAQKVKTITFEYVQKNADIELLKYCKKPLVINICLSNDDHVHQLNRDFRNIDKPTNVLTFANMDFVEFNMYDEVFDEIDLGNIIISYETMQKEADIENITLYAHFCHLLTHGFLHILGFDHIENEDAEYMESLEKAILQNMGIANPYQDED